MSTLDLAQRTAQRDRTRAIAAVRELLLAVGEDADRVGLQRTPERFADLMIDMLSCVGVDPVSAMGAPVPLEDGETAGELVSVTGIPFRTLCEHHLVPFEGEADVSYFPRARLAGFSRIARVVNVAAARPQLQERLGQQVALAVHQALEPHGVVVRLEASHGCMSHLEPHATGARIVTIATAGIVTDAALALTLAGRGRA
ncbi:GTP cyclohydrolase I [Luethyella okanaganae]|uniref:GTP cyclohydrolase 1 n=1 Tax=Luethyella okanaganae TaxID=69372 RepID=A0ABW1VK95_9MICO